MDEELVVKGEKEKSIDHLHDDLIDKVNQEKSRAPGLLDDQLVNNLGQLRDFCFEVLSFAHEYDYSPLHPYNGFRSFVKTIRRYFEKLDELFQPNVTSVARKLPLDLVRAYVDYMPLMMHQVESLKMIRELKDVKPDDTEASLAIELKIQSHQLKIGVKEFEPFFSTLVCGFWLPKSVVNVANNTAMRSAVLFHFPVSQSIPAMFNKKKLEKLVADKAINGSVCEISREVKIFSWLMSSKQPPNATVNVFTLEHRQNAWLIDRDEKKLILNEKPDEIKNTKPIRVVVVRPKECVSDRVIYHIHGGGWVLGKPEMYFGVFKNWISELGVTIVSVDYSLAPAEIYPVALQEITDVYMWLSDSIKNNEILEPLGFVPTELMVTGDSAGGNFTLSLAIVLAEIRKLSPQAVKMPKAFCPLYPAHSPALPFISASSVLLDVVLPGTIRIKHVSAYLTDDLNDPKVTYLGGKNNPWFRDDAKCREVYTRLNGDRKINPILHIFTYDFESLKDVPLYMQAAEFDELLDDAILIAKLWKGKVVFDVLPEVVHGFAYFRERSPECKNADDFVTQRMKEALTS